MQYRSFRIQNYRGIADTTVEMPTGSGTRVTTLIGLNESGKTTVLEAIYSFSPDPESKVLYGETVLLSKDPAYFIPRSQFSSFDGDSTVEAAVGWEVGEKEEALSELWNEAGLDVDPASIPDEIQIISGRKYLASKQISSINWWRIEPRLKTGRQKNYRPYTQEERRTIINKFLSRLPRIAYFPTFVFHFPEKIYLKGGNNSGVDRFYGTIFQSILDHGDEGHQIQRHIVQRYEEMHDRTIGGQLVEAVAVGLGARSSLEMIKQTVDKAADTVSEVVISRWDEIFRHSPLKKEISIESYDSFDSSSQKHDVWLEFKVKDSGTRYNIADRSLGFRWFFCFLLFTKFMSVRKSGPGILFLFDEPASNLHAKAQEKLLESFSEISTHPNSLIFSTHSHYMIEPKWLDRAYIVKNDAIDYSDAGGEQSRSRGVRIEAVKYKQFVSDSTENKQTYFQPVLDRLEIKPSQLDLQSRCIVVEGKSDFYVLSYVRQHYLQDSEAIIPAMGATTMPPLVGILRGWGSQFVVLLDSDAEGREAKNRYERELDLGSEVRLVGDLIPGAKEVESIFSQEDRDKLTAHLGLARKLSKKDISRVFQEACASGERLPLTSATALKLKRLLSDLNSLVTESAPSAKARPRRKRQKQLSK